MVDEALTIDELYGNDSVTQDIIPLPTQPTKSESVRREDALISTTVQQIYDPIEPENVLDRLSENYEQAALLTPNDLIEKAKSVAFNESVDIALEMSNQNPEMGAAYLQARKAELDDESSPSQLMVEGLATIDDAIAQAEASNHYIQYNINKLTSQMTGMETAKDVFGELLAINSFIDRDDLLDLVNIDEVESTKELATLLATMSPEERVKVYPALQAAALDATDGNKLRASRFLNEVFGFSPDSSFSDAMWSTIDVVGLTPFGFISRMLARARKGSTAQTIAKVNPDAGARVIVAASEAENVAEVAGISKLNAAESASPFPHSNISLGAVDNIEDNVVNAVKEKQSDLAEKLELEATYATDEAVLTEAEMKMARQKKLQEINSSTWEKETGFSATNAQVIPKDNTSFTVKFEGINSEGVKIKSDFEVNYTRNDVGSFQPDVEFTGLQSNFVSPSVWANKFKKGIVEKATALGFREEASLQRYLKIGSDLLKPLNKESIAKVDQILLKGDEFMVEGDNVGKVFSLRELMYEGVDGVRLTADEANAYFGMRQMWDHIHRTMEQATIKQWKFDGVRSVGTFNGERVYGKVIQETDLGNKVQNLVDLRTRNVVSVDDIMKEVKDGKAELVRLRRSIDMGDEIYQYGVIRKGSSRNLPASGVLPFRKGYVPKVRENANYVVEAQPKKMVDGVEQNVVEARGIFTSKKEADAFKAQQQAKYPDVKFATKYDRELDPELRSDLIGKQMGRPYTGKRVTNRDIVQSSGVERITAVDALNRNLTAMTNMVTMNEFRMGQLERWRKTASKHLVDPQDVNSGLNGSLADSKINALSSMKSWLDDQFRIPTPSEQRWEGIVRQFAEWTEGSQFFLKGKGKGARLWLHREGTKDITARMRGAAFHALLGWYNPAQLVVQASGATVAMSLNVTKFPKIMMQYKAIRGAIFQSEDVARETAKRLGFKEDEFLDTLRAVKKSGIFESTLTNSDYAASTMGYGIDSGAVKRAASSGLMLFREGEMFNRGYSWLLAADEYRDLHKGISKLSDTDIDNITAKMAQYTMNLNRSNRAAWQTGWTSVPTQFWQVTTKYTETLLGANKALTRRQRVKMAAGQMALFGAAGVPAGNWLLNSFTEWTGMDVSEMSPEAVTAMRGGLVELAAKGLIGEDLDMASRMAYSSGYDTMLDFITDDAALSESLMGAFGEVPSRVFTAVANTAPRLTDIEFSKEEAFEIATEFGSIISTFRNAEKAFIMASVGKISAANGEPIDLVDWESDFRMLIAQASGFSPKKVSDYYQIQKSTRAMQEYKSKVVKKLMHTWNKSVASGELLSEEGKYRFDRLQNLLISGLPIGDQIDVIESMKNNLTTDRLLYEESVKKGVETMFRTGKSGTTTTRMPFSIQNYNEGE